MVISEYKLSKNFNAPRVNLKAGERMSYKNLSAGSSVNGYIFMNTDDPDVALPTDVQVIITSDNFAIPLNIITKLRDVEIDGKPVPVEQQKASVSEETKGPGNITTVPETKKEMPAAAKAELEAIKKKNVVGNVVKKSRNSVTGLMIGGGLGILYGLICKKPVFLSMTVGATAGGLLGYHLNPPTPKDKPEEKKTPEVIVVNKP